MYESHFGMKLKYPFESNFNVDHPEDDARFMKNNTKKILLIYAIIAKGKVSSTKWA